MAHNGNSYDHRIMKYYKLFLDKVDLMDTQIIIPIHMPNGAILKSKKLTLIYDQLFASNFNAHRAMNDVDALIKIMKHLKIMF
jgi:hypothetical protein